MDNNDGKNLYDEMLEIFKNKNYDVKDFVETLEMDSIEKKLDEALIELKNKFKTGRINASNYKNKINRMLEIATEKLPKRRKKSSNSEKENVSITKNEEIEKFEFIRGYLKHFKKKRGIIIYPFFYIIILLNCYL